VTETIGEAKEDEATRAESAEEEAEAEESVSELVEQVGRNASVLVFREGQLRAAQHSSDLRTVARDVTVALGVAVALLTAFALANWAAVDALSSPLPGWRAPLVLAAVWIALALLLGVFLLMRAERALGWQWRRSLRADPAETLKARQQARDEAEQAMRDSLDRLSGAVAKEAAGQIASAALPVAGGVVSAGEGILEATDQITDVIEEQVPGGSVINKVTDVALVPGRYAVKAARNVLKREPDEEEKKP
jgi:hypothetical protein